MLLKGENMTNIKKVKHVVRWNLVENELRSVLGNGEIGPITKLVCIDEILARYTGRGNEIPEEIYSKERKAASLTYPEYFDWSKQ